MTERIEATKALYIKLGEGGKWEPSCIERDNTIRLGYEEAPHELCLQGKWEEITEVAVREWTKDRGAARRHANQIRLFYEAGSDVLWITFYKGLLWWCRSKREVSVLEEDKSRTRPVIGRWRSDDLAGNVLQASRLSGKLLMLQGFRGTICDVRERGYLLRKLNGTAEREVQDAKDALDSLVDKIKTIIHGLHWKDFELLVDLIFTNAGWQRTSPLGETQKTLDLTLEAPILGEQYGVQVKSQADLKAFKGYDEQVREWPGFKRFYFVVHTPSDDLEKLAEQMTSEDKVVILGPRQLAKWSVRYGLVDWIIDKAG